MISESLYLSLRDKIQKAYEQRVRLLKEDRDKELAALHLVCELCGTTTPVIKHSKKTKQLNEKVNKAITTVCMDFNSHDIYQRICTEYPLDTTTLNKKSVSSLLARLAKDGKLEVVCRGRGRAETTYRLKTEG